MKVFNREAGRIAAKRETEIKSGQLEILEKEFEIIDDVFKQNQDPRAQTMKLAILFGNRPDIIEALDDLDQTLRFLSFKKNCLVQFLLNEPSYSQKEIELVKLTKAEQKYLGYILKGHSNEEIALALSRSLRTIENQRARIMKKFGVNNSKDLIHKAQSMGFGE